jgi:hypothetical protein
MPKKTPTPSIRKCPPRPSCPPRSPSILVPSRPCIACGGTGINSVGGKCHPCSINKTNKDLR